MNNEQIRISAKNLGILALDNYCPRCFYLKLKMGFKLPWSIFPGIFSSIDSYSKKTTWQYFEKYGRVPFWFDELEEFEKPIRVPHHSKFFIVDDETGIKLTGVPDDVFQMNNEKYFIVDYKTAKYTDNQDHLLPMYQVQLNGYAMIFEELGMGRIAGLCLCYYEPQGNVNEENIDGLMQEDGFVMPFRAFVKKIELEPSGIVRPLLRKVRGMVDEGVVPRSREGCEDCGRLEEVVRMVGQE